MCADAAAPDGDARANTEPLQSNVKETLNFLQQYAPEGPWVITAISPDGKISTRTFEPGQEAQLSNHIEDRNAEGQNIYFLVNQPKRALNKKAKKTDIKAVPWLHVDIDPRIGEDLVAERERIKHLLTENLPEGIPPPTCIIGSGGGYQAFWRLRKLILIAGDVAKAEEAERYTRALEQKFGADHCHDVCRIMRVPGTVNWPTAKKKANGRGPALARVCVFQEDRVYEAKQFEQAPPKSAAGQIEITVGEEPTHPGVEQLPISDRMKDVAKTGVDTEKPSRSEPLLAVCCDLVTGGASDDTIYAVITDPELGISDSVLGNGKPREYAMRQIKRAREKRKGDTRVWPEPTDIFQDQVVPDWPSD